jgi:hypothetical protein
MKHVAGRAERVLSSCRKVAGEVPKSTAGDDTNAMAPWFGRLLCAYGAFRSWEIEAVQHARSGREAYDMFEHIGLESELAKQIKADSPWASGTDAGVGDGNESEARESKQAATLQFAAYGSLKDSTFVIARMGFHEGEWVVEKKVGHVLRIGKVDGPTQTIILNTACDG